MTDQTKEITTTPHALGPITTVHQAVEQYHLYLQVCQALLTDDDYAIIRGQKWRKRSGWAKLRRAFAVDIDIVREDKLNLDDDWGVVFTVRAILRNGRFEVADGSCMASELADSNIKPTFHNVRAKALTRAKNRASSDILGAGIVSAQELVEMAPKPTRSPPKKEAHWIEDDKVRKRFWAWAKTNLGLNEQQVHDALHVPHIRNFHGTRQDAFHILTQYAQDHLINTHEE